MADGFTLELLPERFAICRLEPGEAVPDGVFAAPFCSITRTGDELSLVVPEDRAPRGAKCNPGWRCLKVLGPLAFELTGVLAALASPLAEAGISIFSVSTYDTDYILVKEETLASAVDALAASGHIVIHSPAPDTTR